MLAIKINSGAPLWLVHISADKFYYHADATVVKSTITLNDNVHMGALNNIIAQML